MPNERWTGRSSAPRLDHRRLLASEPRTFGGVSAVGYPQFHAPWNLTPCTGHTANAAKLRAERVCRGDPPPPTGGPVDRGSPMAQHGRPVQWYPQAGVRLG